MLSIPLMYFSDLNRLLGRCLVICCGLCDGQRRPEHTSGAIHFRVRHIAERSAAVAAALAILGVASFFDNHINGRIERSLFRCPIEIEENLGERSAGRDFIIGVCLSSYPVHGAPATARGALDLPSACPDPWGAA